VAAYLDCLALFWMVLVTTLVIVRLVVDESFELCSWLLDVENVRSHELTERESRIKKLYIRKGQQLYHSSVQWLSNATLSSVHLRAIELEVKIFFMSDILKVVVCKDFFGRKVDVEEREIVLGRERRRRSIAVTSSLGGSVCMYGFGSELRC
jgi:hypothetical protein